MRIILSTVTAIACTALLASCRQQRVHEHSEWGDIFKQHGIADGCFILRDHTHETVMLYNKDRCLRRYTPASTFKIFNSLVALETGIARDDNMVIPWSGKHTRPACDTDLTMRTAFRESCVPYYQELARRAGPQRMKEYLDTVQYGNMTIGGAIDTFWLDGSLQISADEQVGFLKKLYFDELPFTERSQRIVRSMMIWEDTAGRRLSYKTGWGSDSTGKNIAWVVGFAERTEKVKEPKESMNKADTRTYPYFFALNFTAPDNSDRWLTERIVLLHDLLEAGGVF